MLTSETTLLFLRLVIYRIRTRVDGEALVWHTVYVKSFEVEKFRRFRRRPFKFETFPTELFYHFDFL